jgi:hypothetical protein
MNMLRNKPQSNRRIRGFHFYDDDAEMLDRLLELAREEFSPAEHGTVRYSDIIRALLRMGIKIAEKRGIRAIFK